jgi:E3 ubiquitin-protein ligase BAH
MAFLQARFPKEVKVKQKENERAAGIDQYGEDYDKCILM